MHTSVGDKFPSKYFLQPQHTNHDVVQESGTLEIQTSLLHAAARNKSEFCVFWLHEDRPDRRKDRADILKRISLTRGADLSEREEEMNVSE